MASKVVRRRLYAPMPDVSEIAAQLDKNPNIERYSLVVDKRTGIVKATARDFTGRTMTKEVLAPGLESITRFDPSDKSARDAGIRALLGKGLTQQETALKLGCSQALVSRVSRESQ